MNPAALALSDADEAKKRHTFPREDFCLLSEGEDEVTPCDSQILGVEHTDATV